MVESRDKINALCLELLDIVIRKLHCVLNRVYTGGEAVVQSLSAEGMAGKLVGPVMGLVDERLDFFQGEWGRYNQRAGPSQSEIIGCVKIEALRAHYKLFTQP